MNNKHKDHFDLVVIGAGPGGYSAAIRAAQLGLNVACVEKRSSLGGTCLNEGCIPSKALLHITESLETAKVDFPKFGIFTQNLSFDLSKMQEYKQSVVNTNRLGIEFLFKKNKITWIKGEAVFQSKNTILINERIISANKFLIATGSQPVHLPDVEIDEQFIMTSTGALELQEVPEHLVIIGGGVIGIELATIWQRLGSQVTIIEYCDQIISNFDKEISDYLARLLKEKGFTLKLGYKVHSIKKDDCKVNIGLEDRQKGTLEYMEAAAVLVSIGRCPVTKNLNIEKLGVETDKKGYIKTNHQFETNISGIYAIGDVTSGPMLAHKAQEEGIAVAEVILGKKFSIDMKSIPSVIYTDPEVAMVGETEEALQFKNIRYQVKKIPFSTNGRARAMGKVKGFVKILTDEVSNRVLGIHMIGPQCSELIAEATLAFAFGASAEDIALTYHAHPTLSEILKEAALSTLN